MSDYGANDRLRLTRSLFWAALFAVALLFIYAETTWSMISIWARSDTFAHGFLVLPISLWLVWIKRDHLMIRNIQPAPRVGLLLVPPAMLWLLAWMIDVSVVQQLALVTLLIVGVWMILGHKLALVLAFPLFFLYFGVPMGEGLIAPMMEFTAFSTVWLIKLTGIPVYREGLYFSLPSGYWSVVEACSGVRYIIASVTVGTLYAYLTYRSTKRRILFIVISAIVPIFANTARAFIIVMLGHWSGMTIATGVDHLVYGWAFFGIVIFLLFWLGNFFREDEAPPPPLEPELGAESASGASSYVLPFTALGALGLVYMAPWFAYSSQTDPVLDQNTQVALPVAESGWQSSEVSPWYWEAPSVGGGEVARYYKKGGKSVALYLQYDNATPWSEDVLGSSPKFAVWRSGSRLANRSKYSINYAEQTVSVDEATVVGVDDGIRVWSWYDVGGLGTSNAYRAKIQQALAYLGVAEHGTYRIVVAAAEQEDPEEARAVLKSFLQEHAVTLSQNLRQAANVSQ
ncbi:MAG: exosortase A [Halioglobus sp.]